MQMTTADTKANVTVEDTCLATENRVSYETTASFDEKMLPFVQSDLTESVAAGDETELDEDALFSALEDRIDNFLESEGVFVSHVDDAKMFGGPFVVKSRFSQRLPTIRSSINLGK
jgi:hypothetical protein